MKKRFITLPKIVIYNEISANKINGEYVVVEATMGGKKYPVATYSTTSKKVVFLNKAASKDCLTNEMIHGLKYGY